MSAGTSSWSRIASASSIVMRGLRLHSRHTEGDALITTDGLRRSVTVLSPQIERAKSSSMYRFIPSTTLTTVMRNMTPMITPRTAKKLLSFCARIWASASRIASRAYMARQTAAVRLATSLSMRPSRSVRMRSA